MKFTSIAFRNYRCFKGEWAGIDEIKPVTVIIGRNNTGKSHLLHLVKASCRKELPKADWELRASGILDEDSLKSQFRVGGYSGSLSGDHWNNHGRLFVDRPVVVTFANSGQEISVTEESAFKTGTPQMSTNIAKEREDRIKQIAASGKHAFSERVFRHLLADRDIQSETAHKELKLTASGSGATNVIRRFITSSSSDFPRELIQRELLQGLNRIFAEDGRFTEIQIQQHDDGEQGSEEAHWEVFLGEEHKSLIPLSSSGSGLKTIILVLLNLLVVPQIEKVKKRNYVFAFEELENNLHPALIRRLFRYLEDYALEHEAHLFLTTHSSTALDFFGPSEHAQIINVTHDGQSARAKTIQTHFDQLSVIAELGAKPSDLLQANGVVWVEGPSDRVYINKWIELVSDGKWREGRDYQCAFYGGALLARTQVVEPEKAFDELVNLLPINPNLVIVCDGDRIAGKGKGSRLKGRVRRIRSEVETIPGAQIWITDAKEIENYLPAEALSQYIGTSVKAPGQYDLFFPSTKGKSFIERTLKRKVVDKMELALATAPAMTLEMLEERFDLIPQVQNIVNQIERWNSDGRGT